jgi:hypothetical protein
MILIREDVEALREMLADQLAEHELLAQDRRLGGIHPMKRKNMFRRASRPRESHPQPLSELCMK